MTLPEVEVQSPNRDSLVTVCYTSGTTGNPKGVMISHNSLIVSLESASNRIIQFLPDDIYLSYLPLAHMMERMCVNGIMMHGGRVGLFGGDIQKIRDDLALLKPTLFASVPRLFNRMY
jgi:long-chain acyl-CoA synthetase